MALQLVEGSKNGRTIKIVSQPGKAITKDQVFEILEEKGVWDHVVALSQLKKTTEWTVVFHQEEIKNKLIGEELRDKDNNPVEVKPMNDREITGKILWLHPQLRNKGIIGSLQKYGKLIDFHMDKESFKGKIIYNGVRVFKIELKEKVSKDQIPHIIRCFDYQGLVIVYCRQPMCTRCSEIGHITKKCKEIKEMTYAKAMRGNKKKNKKNEPQEEEQSSSEEENIENENEEDNQEKADWAEEVEKEEEKKNSKNLEEIKKIEEQVKQNLNKLQQLGGECKEMTCKAVIPIPVKKNITEFLQKRTQEAMVVNP